MTSVAHHDHLLLKQWMAWGNFHTKRKVLLVELYPLGVKKWFWYHFRAFNLEKSIVEAFVVPSRILSQKSQSVNV